MISNLSHPAKLHLLSLVLLTSGTVAAQKGEPSPHQTGIPGEVYVIGEAMDRLARQSEEWGTMQISAPLLVEPTTTFNFNLQRGASNYFNEAKNDIQIATAYSDQSFQSLKVLDPKGITLLAGQASAISASYVNNSVLVTATVTNTDSLVFAVPWTLTEASGKSTPMVVSAPKVAVSVRKPLDTHAPRLVLKTSQIQSIAPGAPSELTVAISPDASADQISTARSLIESEINKSKPERGRTNVSIEVKVKK